MKITIKPGVFKKFPKLKIGFVIAQGINNKANFKKANHLLADMQKVLQLSFNKDSPKSHLLISPWNTAKEEFGKKAQHYHTSVETLLQKVLAKKEVKTKDTVTALLHYVALKHIVPFGADDPAKLKGDLTFEITGKDIQYRDAAKVLGKKLDYWKNSKTALRSTSKSALLHFEFLPPFTPAKEREVLTETTELLESFCGGKVKVQVLDKKKNSVLFNI